MISQSIISRSGVISRRKAAGIAGLENEGFALLEVVISISVLLVAAFGLTTLNAGTWKNTDSSKSYTEGSVLAARTLETLFSEKYASEEVNGMSPAVLAGDTPFTSADGRYTGTYRIRDNDILPGTKTVQLKVTFGRGSGKRTIRYNYLLPIRK